MGDPQPVAYPDNEAERTLMVDFDRYGPASPDSLVHGRICATQRTARYRTRHDALSGISAIISARGAGLAAPAPTLYMPGEEQATANATHSG